MLQLASEQVSKTGRLEVVSVSQFVVFLQCRARGSFVNPEIQVVTFPPSGSESFQESPTCTVRVPMNDFLVVVTQLDIKFIGGWM